MSRLSKSLKLPVILENPLLVANCFREGKITIDKTYDFSQAVLEPHSNFKIKFTIIDNKLFPVVRVKYKADKPRIYLYNFVYISLDKINIKVNAKILTNDYKNWHSTLSFDTINKQYPDVFY